MPATAGPSFCHTETWLVLSAVKGLRAQSLQRSRSDIPPNRAIRSSSAGHEIGGSIGIAALGAIAAGTAGAAGASAISDAFIAAAAIAGAASLVALVALPSAATFLPKLRLAPRVAIH